MKLQAYRISKELTRAQAAAALGVSVPAYFKWEKGLAFPSASNMIKIMEWSELSVMANDLVGVQNGK